MFSSKRQEAYGQFCSASISLKTDKRLALYLGDSTEDTLFRNRVQVASETLGVSISKLLRESANFALDNVSELRERLQR